MDSTLLDFDVSTSNTNGQQAHNNGFGSNGNQFDDFGLFGDQMNDRGVAGTTSITVNSTRSGTVNNGSDFDDFDPLANLAIPFQISGKTQVAGAGSKFNDQFAELMGDFGGGGEGDGRINSVLIAEQGDTSYLADADGFDRDGRGNSSAFTDSFHSRRGDQEWPSSRSSTSFPTDAGLSDLIFVRTDGCDVFDDVMADCIERTAPKADLADDLLLSPPERRQSAGADFNEQLTSTSANAWHDFSESTSARQFNVHISQDISANCVAKSFEESHKYEEKMMEIGAGVHVETREEVKTISRDDFSQERDEEKDGDIMASLVMSPMKQPGSDEKANFTFDSNDTKARSADAVEAINIIDKAFDMIGSDSTQSVGDVTDERNSSLSSNLPSDLAENGQRKIEDPDVVWQRYLSEAAALKAESTERLNSVNTEMAKITTEHNLANKDEVSSAVHHLRENGPDPFTISANSEHSQVFTDSSAATGLSSTSGQLYENYDRPQEVGHGEEEYEREHEADDDRYQAQQYNDESRNSGYEQNEYENYDSNKSHSSYASFQPQVADQFASVHGGYNNSDAFRSGYNEPTLNDSDVNLDRSVSSKSGSSQITSVRVISQKTAPRDRSDDYIDKRVVKTTRPQIDEYEDDVERRREPVEEPPNDKRQVIYFPGAIDENTCRKCGKRVYEMEKITVDLLAYHKTCFKCQQCNRTLNLSNYASNDGLTYCKPHFTEIFKRNGSYNFAADSRPLASAEDEDLHGTGGSRHYTEADESSRHRDDGPEEESYIAKTVVSEDEIPAGVSRSVRSMFEKIAADSTDSAVPVKSSAGRPGTAVVQKKSAEAPRYSTREEPVHAVRDVEPTFKSKENLREDDAIEDRRHSDGRGDEVVQSGHVYVIEEELPPPAMAKSLLAKFKQMEQEQASTASSTSGASAPLQPKASGQGRSTATGSHFGAGSSARVTTAPAEKQERNNTRSSSTAISVSKTADHSVKEAPLTQTRPESVTETDELPQQGLARSLLQRWRALEAADSGDVSGGVGVVTPRGRTSGRSGLDVRRTQSMSRAESSQRAREYRDAPTVRSVMVSREMELDCDVVSSRDMSEREEGELPPPELIKSRLALFREMQADSAAKARQQITPRRSFKWEVKDYVPASRRMIVVGGDAANRAAYDAEHPAPRPSSTDSPDTSCTEQDYHSGGHHNPEDVGTTVPSSIIEEELPPPAMTRNLLERFKSMEGDVAKSAVTNERRGAPAPNRAREPGVAVSSPARRDDSWQNNSDGSGRGSGRASVGDEVESDRSAVIRESDRHDEDELPEQGTTRNLLARFQSLQSQRQ